MVDSGMIWTYGLLTVQAIAPIILGSFKSLKVSKAVLRSSTIHMASHLPGLGPHKPISVLRLLTSLLLTSTIDLDS